MKIIIVDDEIHALNAFLSTIVDKYDIEYKMFQTRPDLAIKYVQENVVDAAFLDINMPAMNGIELAKKLIEIQASIKIVIISGYEKNEQSVRDEIGENLAGFYCKPYSERDLSVLLNSMSCASKQIKIVTFGATFNVFVNDIPIYFNCKASKELFAYLVHNGGQICGSYQIMDALWEDRAAINTNARYRDAVWRLRKILTEYGIENIVRFSRMQLQLKKEGISCDVWDFVDNKNNDFNGFYLAEYSWGEEYIPYLNDIKEQRNG